MRVSVSGAEGLERKLTIEVPADEVDSSVEARLRETARTVRLNGFRKGKVPLGIVRKRLGPGIRREVVGDLMSRSFVEAVQQEKLRPAGQPKIELSDSAEGGDLRFAAVFEVYPEVELPDFSRIKLENLTAEVTPADVEKMVETLRRQRQTFEPVERAAADGDLVNIDFNGRVDGEEFDGGKGENSGLLLGSERMIPGFEDAIKGRAPGEEFNCELQFPAEYHQAELAGKDVAFDIKLNGVREPRLPEVDEDFYRSFGVEEGGEEAFHQEIARNMERELKTAQRRRMKNQISEAVVKRANIPLPESLLAEEVQRLRKEMGERLGGGQSPELPQDWLRDQARGRLAMTLIMTEIVSANALKADPARVRQAIEELASTYESPEEVIQWYYGQEEQLSRIESSVLEDQAFDFIAERVKLTEKAVSYEEAIRA